MKMIELYERIRECGSSQSGMVLTAIDPELLGEKALVSGGKVLWESSDGGFFSQNCEEAAALHETGVFCIAGRRVFCELIGYGRRMVICGGGHVAIPIIKIASMVGFEVTVIEDRTQFAQNAQQAGADHVICNAYDVALDEIKGDLDTYFVIVTRGHRHDQACLEKIAAKPHAYIGMIGSRRRTRMVMDLLAARGTSREVLDQVYTPIGLDIGSETPAEIAVAVLAEVIQVKSRSQRAGGYPKEILKAMLGDEQLPGAAAVPDRPRALATIVNREGSAPREVGSKMAVFEDGTIAGTVGGGLSEAETIRKAVSMLQGGETKPYLLHSDMTNEKAEEEGMVCGGIMDIIIEPVY